VSLALTPQSRRRGEPGDPTPLAPSAMRGMPLRQSGHTRKLGIPYNVAINRRVDSRRNRHGCITKVTLRSYRRENICNLQIRLSQAIEGSQANLLSSVFQIGDVNHIQVSVCCKINLPPVPGFRSSLMRSPSRMQMSLPFRNHRTSLAMILRL